MPTPYVETGRRCNVSSIRCGEIEPSHVAVSATRQHSTEDHRNATHAHSFGLEAHKATGAARGARLQYSTVVPVR